MSLFWEPLTKHAVVDFTSCSLLVMRRKTGESLKKWKKGNPGWESGLVEMSRGNAGSHEFVFEKVIDEGKWVKRYHDLYLLMKWRGRDGKQDQMEIQLSPTRGGD